MKINKELQKVFTEITNETIKYTNSDDKDMKHLRRILKLFNNHFTEDEQLFIFKQMLEMVHHRNIITDPENVLNIYNVKFRMFFFVFIILLFLVTFVLLMLLNFNVLNFGFFTTFLNIFRL